MSRNDDDFKARVIADAIAAGMPRASAEMLARKVTEPVRQRDGQQQRGIRATATDDKALIVADLKLLSLPISLADAFLAANYTHASARAALRDATRYPVEQMPAWAARMGLQLVAARLKKGAQHAS